MKKDDFAKFMRSLGAEDAPTKGAPMQEAPAPIANEPQQVGPAEKEDDQPHRYDVFVQGQYAFTSRNLIGERVITMLVNAIVSNPALLTAAFITVKDKEIGKEYIPVPVLLKLE